MMGFLRPSRLDAGRHKSVTGVQMPNTCTAFAPVPQSGSCAQHLVSGGNEGWVTWVKHGDIQQDATIGWGKAHLDDTPRPLTARCCNTHRRVTGRSELITARASRDADEIAILVVS
jgi:hypothetical protein